jgi:hypothetical protein
VRAELHARDNFALELLVVLAIDDLLDGYLLTPPLAQVNFGGMSRSDDLGEFQVAVVQQILSGVLGDFVHDEVT